jgi:hypothetical protein
VSRFHVLRSHTNFRRNRGNRVPFSYFALFDSFSAVSRAPGPILMLCAAGLISGGTKGVWSRFQVLRSLTDFQRYLRTRFCQNRARRVSILCFALPNSFSAVPRASGPFFKYCAPRLVFDGTEGVRYNFNVLRCRTHFLRDRAHRVPMSCFALLDSFAGVPRASGPILIFCATELVFDGTEGVVSRFHVLHSRTLFQLYRGCRVPPSCFALLDWFSTVPRTSGLVLMFCAPALVFGGTERVGSRFKFFALPDSFLAEPRASGPVSCFALSNRFSAVPRASGLIFLFCAP